jgi:hypothetical protein
MTLLVLDLRAPAVEAIHNERDLWLALGALAPRLIMCAMTFMTLGIFWVGRQTQRNHRPVRTAAFRGCTSFMAYRIALLVYWVNLLLPLPSNAGSRSRRRSVKHRIHASACRGRTSVRRRRPRTPRPGQLLMWRD